MCYIISFIILFIIFYRSDTAKKRKMRMKVLANLYSMRLMWEYDTLIFKFNKVDISSIDSILFPKCEVYNNKFRNKKLSNQDKEQMKLFLDTLKDDLSNNKYVTLDIIEGRLSLNNSFFVKYNVKKPKEIKKNGFLA